MTTFPASSARDQLLERVGANLEILRARVIDSGRTLDDVRLVAVTKSFGVGEVEVALELGLTTFGENYVDELAAKRLALGDEGTWHFLGRLQTNKIARALRCADVLCGVARDKEIERVATLRAGATIDVQVDFSGEPGRNGAAPPDVAARVARAREAGLFVRGLMVVAPKGERETRAAFRRTVALADELGVPERSMGMSDDLEDACRAGTTELRVGRALFGPRVARSRLA